MFLLKEEIADDQEEGVKVKCCLSSETCVAEMKVLAEYVNYCKNTETSSSEIVFTEEITTYVLESAKKIKTMAINLENNCENALKALYHENSQIGVVPEDDNLQLLLDPADCPKLLTDLQKKKVIQNGPYQPQLKRYPENPNITQNKQRIFSSMWFKEYPHLEHKSTLCILFCLHSFS